MKYLVHFTEEEFEKLVDSVVARRLDKIEKSLTYLAEVKDNEFLKMPDVTRMLNVTDRTIRAWVKSKKLRCFYIGGRQFFRMKDVVDAMKRNF